MITIESSLKVSIICLVLTFSQAMIFSATAQPYTIEKVPLKINTKINADVERIGRAVNLDASATITIYGINDLLSGFVSQVNIPDCGFRTPAGFTVDRMNVTQGTTSSGLVIAAEITTCAGSAYVEAPIDIVFNGQYLRVVVGELVFSNNWFVRTATNINSIRSRLRTTVASAVSKLNEGLRRTQASAFNLQPNFRARFNRPAKVEVAWGALIIELRAAGSIPTAHVDRFINSERNEAF